MDSNDNTGQHIHETINTTSCSKHKASPGKPCWYIYSISSKLPLTAICGRRARAAGHVGKISAQSMSKWSPSMSKAFTKTVHGRGAPSFKKKPNTRPTPYSGK